MAMQFNQSTTDEILNSIGEGVFTVDKDFKITFFNRAAEKITGFQCFEVMGKYCMKVFKADRCRQGCPIVQVLRTGESIYDINYRIMGKDGRKLPLRLNATVLRNHDDDPIGGVISFRDLSYLEIMEEQLGQESTFYGMLGYSKSMRELFQLVDEISTSDANVLILGESGTGKEMFANAIQATSLRRDKPFVKVNCSVFSPQLLASELFGHVRGAFTGAIRDRCGRFELANRGTIFLDEVVEMPLQMQLQLLRVLQEGTFERVGESITRQVDVRTLAGTNMNVHKAIEEGKFREDLYYRLNVVPIEIPPLRDRPEDIPPLVKYFLNRFSLHAHRDIHDIENEAMDLLLNYSWPGNIRELENVIEYAIARTKNHVIRAEAIHPTLRQKSNRSATRPRKGMAKICGDDEFQELLQILERHHWNRTNAAKELGIGRTTLWRKLKALGLEDAREN